MSGNERCNKIIDNFECKFVRNDIFFWEGVILTKIKKFAPSCDYYLFPYSNNDFFFFEFEHKNLNYR